LNGPLTLTEHLAFMAAVKAKRHH